MVPATIHRDGLIDGSMDDSSLGIDRAIQSLDGGARVLYNIIMYSMVES